MSYPQFLPLPGQGYMLGLLTFKIFRPNKYMNRKQRIMLYWHCCDLPFSEPSAIARNENGKRWRRTVVRLRKLLIYPCEGLSSLPGAANGILIAQFALWSPYCMGKVSEGITETIKQPYSPSKDAIKGHAGQDPGLISLAPDFLPASLCSRPFHRTIFLLWTVLQKHLERPFCLLGTTVEAQITNFSWVMPVTCHRVLLHLCFLRESITPAMEQRIQSSSDPTLSTALWYML